MQWPAGHTPGAQRQKATMTQLYYACGIVSEFTRAEHIHAPCLPSNHGHAAVQRKNCEPARMHVVISAPVPSP